MTNFNQPAGTFDANTLVEVSAWVAVNPTDLVTGGGNGNLHFEFYDAANNQLFRNDSFGQQTYFPSGNNNGDAVPDYALVSNSLRLGDAIGLNGAGGTITAATLGSIASIRATISTWNANAAANGQFLIDDFTFSVVVPEPSRALMLLLGGAAVFLRRRR